MREPRPSALFLLAAAVVVAAPAAAVTVKLASLAPDGSVWDLAIEEMGAEWADTTDGRVRLRVYPGGVAGVKQRLGVAGGGKPDPVGTGKECTDHSAITRCGSGPAGAGYPYVI